VNPSERADWDPVEILPRTPNTVATRLHHSHGRGHACSACEIQALRLEIETLRENRCRHGWRNTRAPEQIATPCPACNKRSLFIGSGGHLTCASVPTDHTDGCPSPSVEETVNQTRNRAAIVAKALDKCRRTMGTMNEMDSWIGEQCGYTEAEAEASAALEGEAVAR
jgi:hypothetical protein